MILKFIAIEILILICSMFAAYVLSGFDRDRRNQKGFRIFATIVFFIAINIRSIIG